MTRQDALAVLAKAAAEHGTTVGRLASYHGTQADRRARREVVRLLRAGGLSCATIGQLLGGRSPNTVVGLSEDHAPTDTARRCPSCGVLRPAADYARSTRSPSGRQTYCRACVALRAHGTPPERAPRADLDWLRCERCGGLERTAKRLARHAAEVRGGA